MLLKHGSYDLILLDIMFHYEDGISICRSMRDYVYVPIIFITALSSDSTIIEALEAGGDDYIVKPFTLDSLEAKIKSHLRREERARTANSPNIRVFKNLVIDSTIRGYDPEKTGLSGT